MLDSLSQILGFFESIFEFFINFIQSLFVLLEVIAKAFVVPLEVSGMVPSVIGSSMLIVCFIAFIKFILGR